MSTLPASWIWWTVFLVVFVLTTVLFFRDRRPNWRIFWIGISLTQGCLLIGLAAFVLTTRG